jgi:hypothetical protein
MANRSIAWPQKLRRTLRGRASELMVAVYDPLSGKIAAARAPIPAAAKK